MAITPNFNQEDIKKRLLADKTKIEESIFIRLAEVGEQFIADARSVNTYTDRSGNLRSSIGFTVLKDGEQVIQAFPGDKAEGVAKGKKVAAEAASGFPRGIVLIVVAGMDYAAAVESRGDDVITGSSYAAIAELKATMKRLSDKLQ